VARRGRLGKPITAYTCLRAPIPRQWWPGRFGDTWWLDPKKSPGGGWIDHAIYHIDTLRWLFGSEVARISGLVDNVMDKSLAPGMEDFGVANVVFERGQIAVIEVTWTAKVGGSYNAFQVVGTEGQAVYDQTTSGKLAAVGNFALPGWFQIDAGPQNYSLLDHMIECLENDRPTIASVVDARANLEACLAFYEACLAFYEAARSGRAVSLK